MNKQQLANKIWESANKMRSKIEANEYKDYILGFIFYKYLSENEERWLAGQGYELEDVEALRDGLSQDEIDQLKKEGKSNEEIQEIIDDINEEVKFIQDNIGYFISYNNLYSTWIKKGKDFDVSNVTDALSAFSRLISKTHKKVFEKIFQTLETGLSKLGDSSGARTKAISGLLQLIKDIPMDGKQDYDVLGFIYEYLIEKFAANAGKKAGEFYTPHEVSLLMSEIIAAHLHDREEIKIYDPTSGSGSLLINIGHSVARYVANGDNIKYYAQELKENTYNLTRMNLVMRGIKPDNIVSRCGDTLEDDWPYFDENDRDNTYNPLYVDAVVSNPPYSLPWEPNDKDQDPRYARFGLAPKGKADYAFLLHDLYHIKPDGIMAIVLPHGVLFRGGEEGEIRKNLIENNHIDTIIGLPANIFFGTGIPTIIMILKQKRENSDVLIIDASKGFAKEGKNNKLRASDIKRIADTVVQRVGIEKYSKVVSREEIRANDYNLNIPRYVDSSEEAESWDIYATMYGGIPVAELDRLHEYWKAFAGLRKDLFQDNGTPYVDLAVENIKEAIKNHEDIAGFEQGFKQSFAGFDAFLEEKLLQGMQQIVVSQGEAEISDEIFTRLQDVALVDRYEAYQLLDDVWGKIALDLEIIQTEGFAATKKVDPLMVLKKKGDKEEEIQEGWSGRILPFELVQENLLQEEMHALKALEDRLAEIPTAYSEVADSLTEEEKEGEYYVEEAFVGKEVTKKLKELKNDVSEEALALKEKLQQVENLMREEKNLKSQIKKDQIKLINLSKETIEGLTDEQVLKLLHVKWIDGLIGNLAKLPENIVDTLIKKVEALCKKYDTTYLDLEKQIKETEMELGALLDELDGNEFDMKGLREFKALMMGD